MKKKLQVVIILLMTVSVWLLSGCTKKQSVADSSPVAKAATGIYKGRYNDGVSEFLGIRYAAPIKPFKRARDVTTTTTDVIDAGKWGSNCIQPPSDRLSSQDACSQNCLYLNIWTRDVGNAGKPVIVWIHGGGYIRGGTTDPRFDGEFFVRNLGNDEDCVFVTINYRLSFLGGCDLSVLEGYTDEYADTVNLSKLDQMQALKWINENIEAWGGDAENVTIMGQSSGGVAVFHLMADPDANRYFKRVIEQSGVPMHKPILQTKEEARENSKKIFEILGVDRVEELVSLSDAELSEKIEEICAEIPTGGRYADGRIISASWWEDFRNGSAKDIDLLIGSVNGENDGDSMDRDNFPEPVKDQTVVYNKLEKLCRSSQDEYGAVNPLLYDGLVDEYLTLGNDKVMLMQDLINDLAAPYPSQLIAETQSMWSQNIYLYYWEYVPPKERVIEHSGEKAVISPWSRALHGTDVYFALGTVDSGYGKKRLGDPAKLPKDLVAQTQAAWYSFAKTGNPNNPLIPEWDEFRADSRKIMIIKPDATWSCEDDYRAAAMNVLSVVRPYGEKRRVP